MCLHHISIKELLSSDSNKHQLTDILANAVLIDSALSRLSVYVTWHQKTVCNQPSIEPWIHSHEEADTLMICHAKECAQTGPKHVYVVSTDTDVLVSLMNLISSGCDNLKIIMVAGKGKNSKVIDINE